MRFACASLLFVLILSIAGCGRSPERLHSPDVVSWESILFDVGDLSNFPTRITSGKSLLFSSAAGGTSHTLAGFSSKIYGDLDHGSFLSVQDVEDGVEAVLAEMHGPGYISWMWSANPKGELVLEIDGRKIVTSF